MTPNAPEPRDPVALLQQLRKRLDRLDQIRSAADCVALTSRILEGLVPHQAVRIFLYSQAGQDFAPLTEGIGPAFPVPPTLLNWAATSGEISSVPAGRGSILLAPIPGQFKTLGVLALSSEEDPGSLNQTTVVLLSLLSRDIGRVLENLRVYEQMQRLRELLDNIVESVPHGILAIGLDDAIIAFNRNSEVLFGLHRIEVLGERYQSVLPKPLRETLSSLIMSLLKDGISRDVEFAHPAPDAQPMPIGISCSLLRDREAKPQGFLFICRDLSLSMEVQKLRELDRMKSEFVHTVSHELKTPLTAILGGAEVLQDGRDSLTPDQQEMLDIIDQGGRRLHALITDLLDLSRLESGRAGLERSESGLGDVMQEAAEGVRHKNPRCTLKVEVPPDLPAAMVDADKLKQVFENLIGNALKYSPNGGEVAARLALDGDTLRFTVKDQGIGIAAEHIPLLFDKFYRVDSSTTAEIEGTGLGLAIVKHIIDLHEGQLTVESAPGKGSTFGFAIPFVRPSTS